MPSEENCLMKVDQLNDDLAALYAILMMSYLIEQENMEINERQKLYRTDNFYRNWKKDFVQSKPLQINRFVSTCMPENGKTFLTSDECELCYYPDDQGIPYDMYITIDVPSDTPCGMNIRKLSDYTGYRGESKIDQREVMIPPGTWFNVTKVQKGKKRLGDRDFKKYVVIEMTCLSENKD